MDDSTDLYEQFDSNSETIMEDNRESEPSDKRKLDENDKQTTKKVKSNISKYKQVTPEEFNNIREVEYLYNTILLKYELVDLLSSNTFEDTKRTKKCSQFETWFIELKKALDKIKEYDSVRSAEFLKRVHKNKQKMPAVQLLMNDTYEFIENYTISDGNTVSAFTRPESVHAFGGFKSGACLKADFIPNIAIKMPRAAFYEKDFINNRYLVKRFHYMLYLLYELKRKPFINQIEIASYQNNELLKILRITPAYDLKARIQVFVVPEVDTFKLSRMEPAQNNFKLNVFQNVDTNSIHFSGKLFKNLNVVNFKTSGTALYNTLLLHDMTLEANNNHIEQSLQDYTSCQDAIKLLLVWLKIRHLNDHYTSFTNELLVYTMMHLIQRKKINKHMSSYQIARIFIVFLNESDWRVKPISLSSAMEFSVFTEHFEVVFTDYSGFYNLAGFLDVDIYGKLKIEAAMSVEMLNKDPFQAFMLLFKTNMSAILQYDSIVYFSDEENFKTLFTQFTSDELKWRYFGFYEQLITNQLMTYLKYAMGDRVDYIVPLHIKSKEFKKALKEGPVHNIVFGLKLNPSQALNPLIIGPQQYDAEAPKFKAFWRKLVSLRRFPNASIHEAVFFDKAKTVADKRSISSQIIEFISKKLDVWFDVVDTQFDNVLKLPHMQLPFDYGTNEEATKLVVNVGEEFFKKIRELTLTDVSIQMVQSVSDVFCGTDPFPPIASNYNSGKRVTTSKDGTILLRQHSNNTITPRYVPQIDCIMQINLLNKIAFDNLVMYYTTLSSVYNEMSVILGADPKILTRPQHDCVLVLFKGYVFRLRAFNDREVALLKRMVDDNGQIAYRSNERSVEAERCGNVTPAVYGALNGLYRQHPCFGVATAIAKRWIRAHLIQQAHINDMTINLLMASVFLSPEPFDRPTFPQVAFLRFARLLAEFPFDLLPVVVNFNHEMKQDDITKVESEFLEKRDCYNPLHILLLYDQQKSVFTSKCPNNMIVRRLKQIAIDALRCLKDCVIKQETIFVEPFFVPKMEGYDVIIHLYSTLSPTKHLKILPSIDKPITINGYDEKEDTKFPIVAYSPVDLYMKTLEENYGEFAFFFHDVYGGNIIGVLWNKEVYETKKFKISNVPGRTVVDEKLCFNFDAALEDFMRLGGGLVKDIVDNKIVES